MSTCLGRVCASVYVEASPLLNMELCSAVFVLDWAQHTNVHTQREALLCMSPVDACFLVPRAALSLCVYLCTCVCVVPIAAGWHGVRGTAAQSLCQWGSIGLVGWVRRCAERNPPWWHHTNTYTNALRVSVFVLVPPSSSCSNAYVLCGMCAGGGGSEAKKSTVWI